jgi:hypothetical protein
VTTIALFATLLACALIDMLVRPRARPGPAALGWRSGRGIAIQAAAGAALFGLFLAAVGSAWLAAALAVAAQAVLTVASNAKQAALGEPLVFSDFALLGAVVRHPGFYLSAVPARHRAVAGAGAAGLLLALADAFVPAGAPHLLGAALCLASIAALGLLVREAARAGLAQVPDVDADVARHGLVATLLLYRHRWRAVGDPPPCPPWTIGKIATDAPDLVIVVQCESFADPAALIGDGAPVLPGLARARARAARWGDLHVSGFGAYTMRTEYGVLFGREEEALGFRRFDPFLTAVREASHALPAKLGAAGYRCVFAHPHSLRFYRRDRLMPAIGFSAVIGEQGFPPAPPGSRYLDDATFGAALAALADAATEPTFVYAVTMQNHGPWTKDQPPGSPGGLDAYLTHLRGSDAMLAGLIDRLDATGRRALLVFFGDHRPSIPGAVTPGPERHTPYALLRFPPDGVPGLRQDLTPAGLHHAVLRAVRGG